MKIGYRTCIALLSVLAISAEPAVSREVVRSVMMECPWLSRNRTWIDYLNDPAAANKNGIIAFQVVFDRNEEIGDTDEYLGNRDPLGKAHAGATYTFQKIYGKGSHRIVYSGYDESRKCVGPAEDTTNGLDINQFPLFGEVFTINNLGHVYHSEYGRVGSLRCTISSGVGYQMKRYKSC